MKKLYLLIAIVAMSIGGYGQNTWVQKADYPGNSYVYSIGFSIGTKGYVGGGQDPYYDAQDFWEWNQTTNQWTQKADLPGINRDGAVGFSIGQYGYYGLGEDTSQNGLQDFYSYNPITNTWSQETDFPF